METPMIETDQAFHTIYPGACCGFLVLRGVDNPTGHPALEQRKLDLQEEMRARYADEAALRDDLVLQAYAAYYKRFKKTYHVALQLESIARKGKSIPSVAGLVECMFMAELQNRLLTAGHDLDLLDLPLTVGVTQGGEQYTLLRGTVQECKAGDLFMRDRQGILSAIIYGPDSRSAINPQTKNVLFAVYAPPGIGIDRVQEHLQTILSDVRIITPEVQVTLAQVVAA
jgi:DNA/RNA-binding domain of Phe-tRNA-synthetase-like protein